MNDFLEKLSSRLRLDSEENIAKLRQKLPIEFPSELANPFIDYMLERSYLDDIALSDKIFSANSSYQNQISWIKICRIPVHPNESKDYDLLSRWQAVLSSLHTWNERLLFLLQRNNGITNLYLGLSTLDTKDTLPKLETALVNCMPGISISRVSIEETMSLISSVQKSRSAGAITGIPSFRKDEKYSELQTLDSLAFGIHDSSGRDSDFSIIVVADPINDGEITNIIARLQELGTNVHKDVRRNYTSGESISKSRSVGLQALLASLNTIYPGLGTLAAYGLGSGLNFQKQISCSLSESTEFLNKFAEYTEKVTDNHCNRLRKGRNQGFWNVGVYVLSDTENNVSTVLGMLRSIYSGDESYLEPIRVHRFKRDVGADDIIRSFSLIPLREANDSDETTQEDWHIFGHAYQYLSTPVNTQELSLYTSLPRKDVPGLRCIKTAVRFANNSGVQLGEEQLSIGTIKDYGVEQRTEYKIDINSLVRHSLIVGSTGSGKSTTCRNLITNLINAGRKVLIIEPAKEEYARWACESENINLFMPGVSSFEGKRVEQLKINPFQPAAIEGASIDMMTRCEQFTALVNASLPSSDVLPVIMDETFFTFLKDQPFGADFMQGEMPQINEYPKIEGAIETAKKVLKNRGYTDEVTQGIGAAVETRLTYLSRGKRGEILNVRNSTSWKKLFDETTVINLSRLANPKDRALVMSLILLALQEYRVSQYSNDSKYRKEASQNKLQHLTVIEEAHNILSAPTQDYSGSGNPQQVVANLFSNMLSEIRAYGEGLMIVDQSPTKLISDAIKNTNYKIVHRLTSKEDCAVMDSALALRGDQSGIFPTLAIGDAIVFGDRDDAASWIKVKFK